MYSISVFDTKFINNLAHVNSGSELSWWLSGKESACLKGRCGLNHWVGKTSWRRERQPTLICLPRKSNGKRRLAGYNPWGHKRVGHNWVAKQQLLQIVEGTSCVKNLISSWWLRDLGRNRWCPLAHTADIWQEALEIVRNAERGA